MQNRPHTHTHTHIHSPLLNQKGRSFGVDYQRLDEPALIAIVYGGMMGAGSQQWSEHSSHTAENQWLHYCPVALVSGGCNVLFIGNNQDFTSEGVLK